MEWISIKEQPPPLYVKIKIKADYDDEVEEGVAIFDISEANGIHDPYVAKVR